MQYAIQLAENIIKDRNYKIEIIERFLKENTRESGHVVDETKKPVSIQNIEAQEQKKQYHEWLEQQSHLTDKQLKERLLKKHSILQR